MSHLATVHQTHRKLWHGAKKSDIHFTQIMDVRLRILKMSDLSITHHETYPTSGKSDSIRITWIL